MTLAASTPEEKEFEERLAAVVPSDRQYEWQRKHDVYAFVHFGPNTFTGREWGTGMEDPSVFDPTALDARQWAKALKSAGMTMAVLTAKHHDGFCLWPTRYTKQSVKNSPWKESQGDVVREFVDAVRAEGMDVGIYLSPADLFQIESDGGYYGDGSAYVDIGYPDRSRFLQERSDQDPPRPAQGQVPMSNTSARSTHTIAIFSISCTSSSRSMGRSRKSGSMGPRPSPRAARNTPTPPGTS